MSITLLCLVKGNTTANVFAVDIDMEKLVGSYKGQNDFAGVELKLWKGSSSYGKGAQAMES
jgi:hypothetical protein